MSALQGPAYLLLVHQPSGVITLLRKDVANRRHGAELSVLMASSIPPRLGKASWGQRALFFISLLRAAKVKGTRRTPSSSSSHRAGLSSLAAELSLCPSRGLTLFHPEFQVPFMKLKGKGQATSDPACVFLKFT